MNFDDDDDVIGEYRCPNCGIQPLTAEEITVSFPRTGYIEPTAKITCKECGTGLSSSVTWEDAIVFDFKGANNTGFSFLNSPVITEQEIDEFKTHIEEELEEFYEASE